MTTAFAPVVPGARSTSALLCALVDALTATRSEAELRSTIDAWRARVESADLAPDALLDALKHMPHEAGRGRRDVPRWANADTREFVLVCLEVYTRGYGG